MANQILVKNFKAGGTIAERRFVKMGSNDGEVIQAAAATDAITGVCIQPGGVVANDRVDVMMMGIAEVDFGGTVTRGGLVTSDASGKAVAAAPAAGTNNRIGGFAVNSQVNNDIGDVALSLGSFQG